MAHLRRLHCLGGLFTQSAIPTPHILTHPEKLRDLEVGFVVKRYHC